MALHLTKNLKLEPEWTSFIHKDIKAVVGEINKIWNCPLRSETLGYDGQKCIEYQHQVFRAIIIVDANDIILNVFRFNLEYTPIDWVK